MGFFKKRTFKSVGKGIGASIERQKEKEKIARTLEREQSEADKERALNRRIAEAKKKKFESKGSVRFFRAASSRVKAIAEAQKKRKAPTKKGKKRKTSTNLFGDFRI